MARSIGVPSSHTDHRQFADDVAYYLSLTPRQLPSRYLYDELGSALFEAICRLPWYRITRLEQDLLRRHANDVFTRLTGLSTLVELGAGSGEKLVTLIEAGTHGPLAVHLVDVSPHALDAEEDVSGVMSISELSDEQPEELTRLGQLYLNSRDTANAGVAIPCTA